MTRLLTALLLAAAATGAAAAPPGLAVLPFAPTHTLPAAAVQQALDHASGRPEQRPYRFAVGVPLEIGVERGRWDAVDANVSSWRLRLLSPGARSVSAHLAPLALPPGARLWIYAPGGAVSYGPYTAADVSRLGFWTPVVPGDSLVVDIRAANDVREALRVQVARAFHGYRGWSDADAVSKATTGPGTAGACNVNVACASGSAWAAEARSVALITIGNQFLCSGQLLNNVRQDRRALFLTAYHCDIGRSSGPPESVNFYFNYQAASCDAPPLPRPESAVIGALLLAQDLQSDFTLLRANGALPPNVYFAGWNATGQASASGASIHHPRGDEKKISLYDTPTAKSAVNIGTGCEIDAWQVQWREGTTEIGSSGGGLWSSGRQVIGVLTGGLASCTNPSGLDYYGRLDRAWTAQTVPEGQLKAHLDPDGTCIASVPGLDPATTPGAAPVTSGPTRCEGELSTCFGPGGDGGGGAPGAALLALLALAAVARRRS